MTHLEAEKSKGEVTSFEDKVRKLQKHQAFNAELQAHEPRIKKITEQGKKVLFFFIDKGKLFSKSLLLTCTIL